MAIRYEDDLVVIEGHASVDDALPLAERLAGRRTTVDLRNCEGMHTAVLQTLAAAGQAKILLPPDRMLARTISCLCTSRGE